MDKGKFRLEKLTTTTTTMPTTMYDNYTIFELCELISCCDIKIKCPFNKESLIKIIEDNNLDILSKLDPMDATYWYPSVLRCNKYFICTEEFHIYERDIIVIDNIRYSIAAICYEYDEDYYDGDTNRDNLRVTLKNINLETYSEMSGTEFVRTMDSKMVTYEYSLYLD